MLDILSYIFEAIYIITIVSTMLVIVTENKNPVKTLSWMLVLIFIPILGLILYLYFGQNYRRKKIFKKSDIREATTRPDVSFDVKKLDAMPIDNNQVNLIKLLYNNNSSEVYSNNDVRILATGEATFQSLFEEIEKAKDHIHIEFFIIRDDQVSNQLKEILIRKAKQNVRIRLIYDYWGSFGLTKRYLKSLTDVGVFVRPFLPLRFRFNKSKINYRNHRKILVVDGKVGFIGGINIADRYLYGNSLGAWRDTFVRFEGAVVHGLQMQFLIDWYFVEGKLISDAKYYPIPSISERKNFVQIVSSGPDTNWPFVMQGITSAIMSSSKYIYIHTPYFIPNQTVNDTLIVAALSGVDVRLMVPRKSDSPITTYSSNSYLAEIMKAGVKVYQYTEGFLHSKAIVIDDFISIIGSCNLDERSFYQNFEANSFIYEKETALELKQLFLEDQKKCVKLDPIEWEKRSRFQKFKESIARLASPLQ